ncbi:MAG: hypothetical protein HYZ51_01705 [Candidatus Doudnabacteria bacterium]|nr:hypothetical protein [Candidatus Doudnabacteria bacterium]
MPETRLPFSSEYGTDTKQDILLSLRRVFESLQFDRSIYPSLAASQTMNASQLGRVVDINPDLVLTALKTLLNKRNLRLETQINLELLGTALAVGTKRQQISKGKRERQSVDERERARYVKILEFVRDNPGATAQDIAESFVEKITVQRLRYCLSQLTRTGQILSKKNPKHIACYYPISRERPSEP